MKTRGRSDKGAVTVELAIILPIIGLIICAIIDLGYRYEQSAMINNAAMVAARDMTIHNSKSGATAAAVSNGAPSDSLVEVIPPICVADTDVTVKITSTISTLTRALGENFIIHGEAMARCTQ